MLIIEAIAPSMKDLHVKCYFYTKKKNRPLFFSREFVTRYLGSQKLDPFKFLRQGAVTNSFNVRNLQRW